MTQRDETKEKIEEMYIKGELSLKRAQNKDAYEIFNKIIEMDPNHSKSYNKIGVILAQIGEKQEAKSLFNTALDKDKTNVSAMVNLGNIHFLEENYQEAKKLYLAAFEMDKENPVLLNNLATIYRHEENIEDYLKYFKLAQRFHKDNIKKEIKQDNVMSSAKDIIKGEKKGCLGPILVVSLIMIVIFILLSSK